MDFLNKAERSTISERWLPADGIAAAVMLRADLITKSFLTNVEPVVDGRARGIVLVDYLQSTGITNAEIIQSFDVERFKRMLIDYLS